VRLTNVEQGITEFSGKDSVIDVMAFATRQWMINLLPPSRSSLTVLRPRRYRLSGKQRVYGRVIFRDLARGSDAILESVDPERVLSIRRAVSLRSGLLMTDIGASVVGIIVIVWGRGLSAPLSFTIATLLIAMIAASAWYARAAADLFRSLGWKLDLRRLVAEKERELNTFDFPVDNG
jgi:hypothetical protein